MKRGGIDPAVPKQWLQGKTITHQHSLLELQLDDTSVVYIHTLALSRREPKEPKA